MNAIARDIINEFGLEELPEAEKLALIEQLSDVVMQAVMIRGLESLDESQKDELDAALEKAPENIDIMLDFFTDHIPNFDVMVQEEVARVRARAKAVAVK